VEPKIFSAVITKEKKRAHIAYCPELEVTSQGKSEENA